MSSDLAQRWERALRRMEQLSMVVLVESVISLILILA